MQSSFSASDKSVLEECAQCIPGSGKAQGHRGRHKIIAAPVPHVCWSPDDIVIPELYPHCTTDFALEFGHVGSHLRGPPTLTPCDLPDLPYDRQGKPRYPHMVHAMLTCTACNGTDVADHEAHSCVDLTDGERYMVHDIVNGKSIAQASLRLPRPPPQKRPTNYPPLIPSAARAPQPLYETDTIGTHTCNLSPYDPENRLPNNAHMGHIPGFPRDFIDSDDVELMQHAERLRNSLSYYRLTDAQTLLWIPCQLHGDVSEDRLSLYIRNDCDLRDENIAYMSQWERELDMLEDRLKVNPITYHSNMVYPDYLIAVSKDMWDIEVRANRRDDRIYARGISHGRSHLSMQALVDKNWVTRRQLLLLRDTDASAIVWKDATPDRKGLPFTTGLRDIHDNMPWTDEPFQCLLPIAREHVYYRAKLPNAQTPGLFVTKFHQACRVDGCTTRSDFRICPMHYQALYTTGQRAYVDGTPNTINLLCDTGRSFAYYHTETARPNGSAHWQGIQFRPPMGQY